MLYWCIKAQMLTQKADRRAYAHPKERLIGLVGKNRNRKRKCRHKYRKRGKRKCRQASVSDSTTASAIRSRGKSAGDTRTGGA